MTVATLQSSLSAELARLHASVNKESDKQRVNDVAGVFLARRDCWHSAFETPQLEHQQRMFSWQRYVQAIEYSKDIMAIATLTFAFVSCCSAAIAAPSGPVDQSTSKASKTIVQNSDKPDPSVVRVAGTAYAQTIKNAYATYVNLTGDDGETQFALDLTRGVTVEVFTLANPYRVVIDLPHVKFRLPRGSGLTGRGLVSAYRFGLFSPGKGRVVIDTKRPVRITKAEMVRIGQGGQAVKLSLALSPTDAATFGRGTGSRRAGEKARSSKGKEAGDEALSSKKPAPKGKRRPMIVVDPGHGGIDPGAKGVSKVYEKTVVLAVAKRLAAALRATGRYSVAMTRTRDVFISLDGRLRFSRKKGADLFISLHADSIGPEKLARTVRGATVYTLSETASDEEARRSAEKENSSDLLAGLQTEEAEGSTQVRSILFDLMKRETANFSVDFSQQLIRHMRNSIALRRRPLRSAAFKVLKQTNTPSVLIELGYLSNTRDERLLRSVEWQKLAAKAITKAVDAFFRKQKSTRN